MCLGEEIEQRVIFFVNLAFFFVVSIVNVSKPAVGVVFAAVTLVNVDVVLV